MESIIEDIRMQVIDAQRQQQPLHIVGGNSKAFYGRAISGNRLELGKYSGIVSYEPTELYITARAGTSLHDIEHALAEDGQMLAFEPPRCAGQPTVGGTVASGLSGPRRPYAGATRDFVLGIKCMNGLGQVMNFGGQVMKNVAGYDLSRLLTGSLGTLGVILEVSLKVLPRPKLEMTCVQQLSLVAARQRLQALAEQPLPLSAAAHDGAQLYLRLSGSEQQVEEAQQALAMETMQEGDSWWQSLRDYRLPFFDTDQDIWRLSLPVTSRPEFSNESVLLDWGGAQYWLASNRPAQEIFGQAAAVGGSATLFRTRQADAERFQPLPDGLMNIHQGLKDALDPKRILNPGRMYANL